MMTVLPHYFLNTIADSFGQLVRMELGEKIIGAHFFDHHLIEYATQ